MSCLSHFFKIYFLTPYIFCICKPRYKKVYVSISILKSGHFFNCRGQSEYNFYTSYDIYWIILNLRPATNCFIFIEIVFDSIKFNTTI